MKSRFTSKVLAAGMLLLSVTTAHAQLVINELMQSNIDLVMDDLNDFPDSWVELYNSGNTTINLGEYSISIDNDAAQAWKLPSQNLAAGSFILMYCDKEAKGRHTDFRLDSGKGGSVYLFKNGKVVDSVTKLKKQPAPGIAYGRNGDGGSEWGYMYKATPEATNNSKIANDILSEPVFSNNGFVTDKYNPCTLTLSLPEGAPEGTVIRYTTNGTEPNVRSKLYKEPIVINTTTIIRAKLFCNDWLSPRSTIHSYIFHGRQQTLPVVSISTDDKYLYDDKIGIYVEGTYKSGKKNFEFDWRRPMNIELFEQDGTTCPINQLIEARIQGGQSRNEQYKSFALYANKRFGEKRLAYEFFPDQRPGQTNFKSLLLRNAGNDFNYLYMRDAIIQRTMSSHCDIDWQAWRPVIVYINGKYSGMLNVRERSNDDNIFTNYEELEDIDMIENWWDLKAGTWDNFNAFKAFYTEHGHTLAEYEKWMDVEEFINVMVTNLFYCNLDFPGNNIVLWRPRAEGGRWRIIMKDTDFGLGLYGRDVNFNTLEWIHNNNYDPNNAWANTADATRLLRRLEEDADFKRKFIDHFAVYMGDFMNEKGTRKVWDPMYEMIRSEYPYHRALINQWWPNYNDEINNARTWIRNRPNVFYNILANYYKLGTPHPLRINSVDAGDARVLLNDIPLSTGNFDGKMFEGSQVTLSSIPGEERQVVGWTINMAVQGKSTTTTINAPTHQFIMPNSTNVSITPIFGAADGIENVTSDNLIPLNRKEIRNGQVIIIRNGHAYNASGIKVVLN